MSNYENQVVVVTGGNSGIGAAIAQEFADGGAKVVIFGRSATTLEATRQRLGDTAVAVQGDVTSSDDLDRLFAVTNERFGRVDTLVVNAGIGKIRPFAEVDEAHYDLITDINVKGAFFTAQKALPLMGAGGTITFISSVVNVKGFPGLSVYNASKAAVRSLARTLAAELAPLGIRVNSLSPGPIETPIFDRMDIPADSVDEAVNGGIGMVPLQRIGQPAEIAATVGFLASSGASFINGADVPVDGGLAQV
jgi:NAD(P)-dependent dehydrogenase (short-subunit alcohol dehydrogenase family)